jgi:signal transduction histidine kinase
VKRAISLFVLDVAVGEAHMGLGLPITKGFAELLGGSISVGE